ncbi:MAG: hypothetical protein QNJ47_28860 [Nostocaceae cyanobacterium]|nr:hypothetical protein [Nostocaceae cyanobacterium]
MLMQPYMLLAIRERVTLAFRGVRRLDSSVAIITYLLAELELLKINVKKLYLDRGFFNTPVIRWLQACLYSICHACYQDGKTRRNQEIIKREKKL